MNMNHENPKAFVGNNGWIIVALFAVVVDGLRLEQVSGWRTPIAWVGSPIVVLILWSIIMTLWPRSRSWYSIGVAVALLASLPMSLGMDLLGVSVWVLAVAWRGSRMVWKGKTPLAMGLFCVHVIFLWTFIPIFPLFPYLGIGLIVAVAMATSILPVVLIISDESAPPKLIRG